MRKLSLKEWLPTQFYIAGKPNLTLSEAQICSMVKYTPQQSKLLNKKVIDICLFINKDKGAELGGVFRMQEFNVQ